MKLYVAPGSCATGIHILLEEIDEPFEAHIVNPPPGEPYKADPIAVDPKSTVPTLVRDDGSALTEFQAIARWLARSNPKSKLLPEDRIGEALVIEAMDYVVGTIHQQGFAHIFGSTHCTPDQSDPDGARNRGRETVEQGFEVMNEVLAAKEYVADTFSIADAALFYVELWADKLNIALPPNCLAHYQRMLTRPAVQRVLREAC